MQPTFNTPTTMSTLTSYGSLDVNQVRIHAEPTQDNHAATRLYVNTVRDGILGDGVSGALDTLKELGDYLQDGSVSSGLVSQLTSVQTQVTAEVVRASAVEGGLRADLTAERGARIDAVAYVSARLDGETQSRNAGVTEIRGQLTYLGARIDGEAQSLTNGLAEVQGSLTYIGARVGTLTTDQVAEVQRATAVEANLQVQVTNASNMINTELMDRMQAVAAVQGAVDSLAGQYTASESAHSATESALGTAVHDERERAIGVEQSLLNDIASAAQGVNNRTDGLLAGKLNTTGGILQGDLNVTGQLYIGPNWKVVAVGASLEFQYSPDGGESWSTGIPFISV